MTQQPQNGAAFVTRAQTEHAAAAAAAAAASDAFNASDFYFGLRQRQTSFIS